MAQVQREQERVLLPVQLARELALVPALEERAILLREAVPGEGLVLPPELLAPLVPAAQRCQAGRTAMCRFWCRDPSDHRAWEQGLARNSFGWHRSSAMVQTSELATPTSALRPTTRLLAVPHSDGREPNDMPT